MQQRIAIILFLFLFGANLYSQDQGSYKFQPLDSAEVSLEMLAQVDSSLSKKVNISVADVPLTEFVRGIAQSSGANISVSPEISSSMVNSFTDVSVVDVLVFLKRQYNLNISVLGNIIIISPKEQVEVKPKCEVIFDQNDKTISVDTEGAELIEVLKEITSKTKQNISCQVSLNRQKITSFIIDLPVEKALAQLAYSNDLEIAPSDDGLVFLKKKIQEPKPDPRKNTSPTKATSKPEEDTYELSVRLSSPDSIWLYANNAPIVEIIKEVSIESSNSYIIGSPPEGNISLQLSGVSYMQALSSILTSTEHVYKKQGDIFLIGRNDSPDLMKQELVHMQFRTVDSIIHIVPQDLLGEIETKIFREQNSIMLSGPPDKVDLTTRFLKQVDKLVPVISIEVMIIDYNKSFTINTGLQAGLLPEGETIVTQGSVLPSIDMAFSSESINTLINRFNGFGWAKIGNVSPNFYMTLQAMENQGILKIRSTPILSTLNGHKAELSIGDTEYYLEEQLNIIGTQNPQSQKIQTYKPVAAELSVYITPIVSGDDQITLEIEVNQSDFTERISTNAPPGKVERTFKSQIRVKNEEMILLGGLEENRKSKTSTGVPWLSKVPILKWFFSSKSEENSKSKLNIFIKPTIIS